MVALSLGREELKPRKIYLLLGMIGCASNIVLLRIPKNINRIAVKGQIEAGSYNEIPKHTAMVDRLLPHKLVLIGERINHPDHFHQIGRKLHLASQHKQIS